MPGEKMPTKAMTAPAIDELPLMEAARVPRNTRSDVGNNDGRAKHAQLGDYQGELHGLLPIDCYASLPPY